MQQVRELQDRAARAVPAAVQEVRDGCWLRHTDSPTTWWAGATLVHGQPSDLDAAVGAAERFYAEHGAPARFQVCPACPTGLDAVLARRGYERSGDVTLMVADAQRVARSVPAPDLRVAMTDRPDLPWVQLLLAAQGPGADLDAEWRLLQRIDRPAAWATASLTGERVAVGRAVADAGWAGVFGMATLPAARGRGAGTAVLAALSAWADRSGCPGLYLQVTRESGAARALYCRAGFRRACDYHYRVLGR